MTAFATSTLTNLPPLLSSTFFQLSSLRGRLARASTGHSPLVAMKFAFLRPRQRPTRASSSSLRHSYHLHAHRQVGSYDNTSTAQLRQACSLFSDEENKTKLDCFRPSGEKSGHRNYMLILHELVVILETLCTKKNGCNFQLTTCKIIVWERGYGARSRSRLCRRLPISLVRYRHGLEKFLEHHFIPIRRRFNPHDLPTDLLRVQDPFFFGEEGRSFRQETSMAWHGLFLCGRSSLI